MGEKGELGVAWKELAAHPPTSLWYKKY